MIYAISYTHNTDGPLQKVNSPDSTYCGVTRMRIENSSKLYIPGVESWNGDGPVVGGGTIERSAHAHRWLDEYRMPGRHLLILGLLCVLAASMGCDDRADGFLSLISQNDLPTVRRLLQSNPKLAKAVDGSKENCINRAVDTGNLEMVRLLIRAGADVNNECPRLGRPLSAAAYYGKEEIAKELIAAGAEINRCASPFSHHTGTALTCACSGGQLNMVKLLLEHGADVHARDGAEADAGTAILAAIKPIPEKWEERKQIVLLLLAHEADINAKGTWNHTPMWWGRYWKIPDDIMEFLRQHGAKEE